MIYIHPLRTSGNMYEEYDMSYANMKADFTQNLRAWARRLDSDLGDYTPSRVDVMIRQLQSAGYSVPGRQAAITLAVRNMPEIKSMNVSREESRTIAQMVGTCVYLIAYRNQTDSALVMLGEIASDKMDRLMCFAAHATLMIQIVERAIATRNGDYKRNTQSVTGIVMGKIKNK